MEVLELACNLKISATSFVGRISLGELSITVQPKIAGVPLLRLFRYAYGLRSLDLYGDVDFGWSNWSFQDLLIHQLEAEVAELLERGIHREYEQVHANLASPRGRIDFARYVRVFRSTETTLPCVHHPRIEDTLLNRVLLGGLDLGIQLATDRELKGRVQRLANILSAVVSDGKLTGSVMADAWQELDRRTTAYEPAFKLVELLLNGQGLELDDPANPIRLNGFLFDMNRFFQGMISRLLREHLDGVEVHDEFRLKGMFRYEPGHNPLGRKHPVLRPDFALLRDAEMVAVLDAKYRTFGSSRCPEKCCINWPSMRLAMPATNDRLR
jgi:5-methylcytosine-specific restriction enzyme subunit McrC